MIQNDPAPEQDITPARHTVTENGGRYKGNKAKWKYSFKIK